MRRCLLGEQVEVDPYQSDVFSLGITMLQLAQGKPESIATAWRTVEDLQRAVEEEIRDLPCSEAFVDLIRHMLKMNPQERLQFHQIRQKILPEASNSPTPPSTMEDFYSQLSLAAKLLSSGDYTGTESVLLRLMPTVNKSPLKEKQLPWLLKAFSSLYMLQGRSTERRWFLEEMIRQNSSVSPESVSARAHLAINYRNAGKFQEAKQLLRELLSTSVSHFGEMSETTEVIYSHLLSTFILERDLGEAKELARKRQERLRDMPPDMRKRWTSEVLVAQAHLYLAEQKWVEANDTLLKALDTCEGLLKEEPPFCANIYYSLGKIALYQGKLMEAETLCVHAKDVLVDWMGEGTVFLRNVYATLGVTYLFQRKFLDAEDYLARSLTLTHKYGNECADTGACYSYLGLTHLFLGRHQQAADALVTAVRLKERFQGKDYAEVGICYYFLSTAYQKLGRQKEAAQCFEQAQAIQAKTGRGSAERTALSFIKAQACLEAGRLQEAGAILARELERMNQHSREALCIMTCLATVYFQEQRLSESEALLIKAVDVGIDLNCEEIGEVFLRLSEVLFQAGRVQEARDILEGGCEITTSLFGTDHPMIATLCGFLQMVQIIQANLAWLSSIGRF